MIADRLTNLIDIQSEKLNTLKALQLAHDWFREHFNANFTHENLRGNDITPSIILATEEDVYIPLGILVYFEHHINYPVFKKYLISFGTVNYDGKTYIYIQSNIDLINHHDTIEIMKRRNNKEVFQHIDKYFV